MDTGLETWVIVIFWFVSDLLQYNISSKQHERTHLCFTEQSRHRNYFIRLFIKLYDEAFCKNGFFIDTLNGCYGAFNTYSSSYQHVM